jgi:hypothetical protein
MTRALACAVAILALAVQAAAQTPAGSRETREYSYGLGRIAWTFPPALAAGFAVGRWSAGARIECLGGERSCDVQVYARDVTVDDEDLRIALERDLGSRLPGAAVSRTGVKTRGGIAWLSAQDRRRGVRYRDLTLGYAYKGAALVRFELATDRPADLDLVLQLIESARALDAAPAWSGRLREFLRVCNARYPEMAQANTHAFAASRFAPVKGVPLPAQPQGNSLEAIAYRYTTAFETAFDDHRPAARRAFCENFPHWIGLARQTLAE